MRIYGTLTNVVVITHFDNKRAAVDQNVRMTMRRRQSYDMSMSLKLRHSYNDDDATSALCHVMTTTYVVPRRTNHISDRR